MTFARVPGEMAARIAGFDWSRTPLGHRDRWPVSLRTVVEVMLHSRQPMFLWWGPDLIQLYNDAYVPSLGRDGKHPVALGQGGRETWQEIWPIIGPQIDDVMARGLASWNEDHLVPIYRNRRIEEVYWTYGYSPVFDEAGRVGGILVVCTETTSRVLAQRRMASLRMLAENTPVDDLDGLIACVMKVCGASRSDLPFALAYRRDADGGFVRTGSVGLDDAGAAAVEAAARSRLTAGGPMRLDPPVLPTGPRFNGDDDDAVASGFVASIGEPGELMLVLGLSSRLPFDPAYQDFVDQLVEQLRGARADLAARAKAHAEREALLAELREASRAKDEFLAMLGHELRNPLAPIVTALELMKARGQTGGEVPLIERQVQQLVRLVDDLLDVARITRGQVQLVRATVELGTVVTRALEIAAPVVDSAGHRLEVDVPAHGLTVDADLERLAQVVANLLTNAAKYTPDAGTIAVTARRDGGEVTLSVRDNGLGIDPEMLPRLFAPFTQAPQDLARSRGGLGLGLAIVNNLMQLHGGTVAVASRGRGQGSEFTLRLPLADPCREVAVPAAPPRAEDAPALDGLRLLIVDDNEDAASILAEVLGGFGAEVTVVHDGLSGLREALAAPPQVALLDIGLPGIDGYELARRMRADPRMATCRLIAMTGYGQDSDRAQTTAAGFDLHLVKPVSIDTLAGALAGLGR